MANTAALDNTAPITAPVIPHIKTRLKGPLLALEERLLGQQAAIEHWFRLKFLATPPPLYASCDVRNAGFKVAPVDTNIFPAGFNNLHADSADLSALALENAIERHCRTAQHVAIITESHTRNMRYYQSVATLRDLMIKAGFQVALTSLAVGERTDYDLPDGQQITLYPLVRKGNELWVNGARPCSLILNNDLSAGLPAILENTAQPILPSPHLGWHHRTKSAHFGAYRTISAAFATEFALDPWSLASNIDTASIDFQQKSGVEELASRAQTMLDDTRAHYTERGIQKTPFVVIKADSGTYGMGIIMVKDGAEVLAFNRKQRKKMSVVKDGMRVAQVLIQEGVPSVERVVDAVAEPVVYMIDHQVVGGFYRLHDGRGEDENLNAQGMMFEPLAFADRSLCASKDEPNRFYVYSVISRLALLASAHEMAEAEHAKTHAPT